MSAKFFIDTNVLIYTFDQSDPVKKEKAIRLVGEALEEGSGIVSFQVVQEFLSAALHKFKKPLSGDEISGYYEEILGPLCGIYPDAELYRKALRIHRETQYHFYDSLIIASALEAGCKTLYSEDLQNGRRIAGLAIKDPFR